MLFLIPLVLILPFFWQLNGVWIAFPIADILAFSVTYIIFDKEMKTQKIREAEHTVRQPRLRGERMIVTKPWPWQIHASTENQWLEPETYIILASIRNLSSRAPFWRIHTSLQGWKPSRTQQSWLRCNLIYIYISNYICANISQHQNKQCLWWSCRQPSFLGFGCCEVLLYFDINHTILKWSLKIENRISIAYYRIISYLRCDPMHQVWFKSSYFCAEIPVEISNDLSS